MRMPGPEKYEVNYDGDMPIKQEERRETLFLSTRPHDHMVTDLLGRRVKVSLPEGIAGVLFMFESKEQAVSDACGAEVLEIEKTPIHHEEETSDDRGTA